jgi:hypothetical protein
MNVVPPAKRFAPLGVLAAVLLAACGQGLDPQGLDAQTAEQEIHATFTPGSRVHAMPRRDTNQSVTNAATNAHLSYYGGHVISNVKVVQVLYGSGTYISQVSSTGTPSMASFYGQATNSAYMDWLSEYNTNITAQNGQQGTNQTIGRGTFNGQVQITPSSANNGSTIDDTNIQAEINAQINAGTLPAPDANTLYMINFPKGKHITQGGSGSCVAGGFCAYHGTFTRNSASVYYGVLPDMSAGSGCDTGCGASTTFNNQTSVASHEMIEAVTDAEVGLSTVVGPPLAWYDGTNGEIGDICNAQQGTISGTDGQTYTVQKEWDNATSSCIVSKTTTNDFSISASPSSLSLAQSASGNVTVSTATTSGSAQTVSLSVTGVPSGASASFSPTSVTSGGSSTLTINAGTAAAGTYSLSVKGTGTSTSHTTTVTLTITSSGGGGGGNALTNGVPVSNLSAATGADLNFTMSVPSGASGLKFTISGGTGDADLYVKFGSAPTLSSYDCRPYVTGNNETCNITTAQVGTYYVMLHGYAAFSGVTLTGSYSTGGGTGGGITNGGFESGSLTGWTASGAHSALTTTAHSGSYAALVGNSTATSGDSSLAQTFTAPSGVTRLSLYYAVSCPDTVTYDWATVTLKDNTTGTTTTVLPKTCPTSYVWTNAAANVTAGHSYTLTLTSHDDGYSGDPTYTLYDDVTLQ